MRLSLCTAPPAPWTFIAPTLERETMRPNTLAWRVLVVVSVLTVSAMAQAQFTEEFTIDAQRLFVGNLIGEITVEGHSGSNFEVTVEVQGDDADRDLIQFEQNDGDQSELLIIFPIDDHRNYVYPELGRGSRTNFRIGREGDSRGSWLGELFGRKKIEVRGRGNGLELWADVTIKVPAGKEFAVETGAGNATVMDVQSDVYVSVRSGHILAENLEGEIELDTGSGHIEVAHVTGALVCDTGSGHVEAMDIQGEEVLIDTGSGNVDLEDCQSEGKLVVDTGSGRVQMDNIVCSELEVDTGSGSVQARGVSTNEAMIDTGSGSVTLDLLEMGDGDYVIDTGSGSINLYVPDNASAAVHASTGSGGIDVDVDDVDFRRRKHDHVELVIGDAASDIDLETGSGSILIAQR